jgi:hypothetical protein
VSEPRNVTARPAPGEAPPLHTPLVWAWGSLLLTVTLWLTGMIAVFRSVISWFH